MSQEQHLLSINSLSVSFPRRRSRVKVLDRASLFVDRGEMVGLVGESGSGKTLSSLAVTGFLPASARLEEGEIYLDGMDLLSLSSQEMGKVRGRKVAMVFQSPRTALNPMMRAGDQVARSIHLQQGLSNKDAYREAVKLLSEVGIADPERRARAYPHQLSGGMCQRVLIAMMLACRPPLLIADEPTTGLDVTIQAQIFELIRGIQRDTGTSILLITHDLGVVAEMCRRVIVMYAGQIMESAPVDSFFESPVHPYSRMLMSSVLRVDRNVEPPEGRVVLSDETTYGVHGCRFAPRCAEAQPVCWEQRPELQYLTPDHTVSCHRVRGQDGTDHQG